MIVVDTPIDAVEARPGDTVTYRLRVQNDARSAVNLSVRVHGLGAPNAPTPLSGGPVAAGQTIDIDLPLAIPEDFGVGDHAVAIEVRSDKVGEPAILADLTVSIGTLDKVVVRVVPSIIRGGRASRFTVEAINRKAERTELQLFGSGPDLEVRLDPARLVVGAGETAVIKGLVKGPPHRSGDALQHVLTVEARGRSVPSYATASFHQRAIVPRRLRAGLVVMAVVLVWALIAGTTALWWSQRDNDRQTTSSQDGTNDQTGTAGSGSEGGDASGDGTSTGAGGAGGGAGGAGAAGAAGQSQTETIIRGTVAAGETGADDGVLVTLTPTIPGSGKSSATTSGASTGVKFWPARYGTYSGTRLSSMRTISVATANSDTEGSWNFSAVPLRQSYEVSFAKAGFTTRSEIVTPPDDGKPVELDVVLAPGDGGMSGRITSAAGGVGGAAISITDGTLTFATTSSTDAASRGEWSLDHLSTPATYTLTVTASGYGTEVVQVTLDPGQSRTGINIVMSSGVGSILGTVRANGVPLGGVDITATAGDLEAKTTSLTLGAIGTYSFPQLPIGETFTLTAASPGYITQTRSITVNGNVTNVDFELVQTTATIVGRVFSQDPASNAPRLALVNASISVTADALQVRTSTAAAPDAGAFTVKDLPPGTYVVQIGRYDHASVSQVVTLAAGQILDLQEIVLERRNIAQLQATGSLIIHSVDSDGADLNGATVALIDNGGRIATVTKSMPATENDVEFTQIPIGTYDVRVTKNDYRPTTISRLSIGLGPVERTVTMLQFGTARGTVVDGLAGTQDTPLLDDRGNPVYTDGTSLVYIDPTITVPLNTIVPPLTCYQQSSSGPCYVPTEAYRDNEGALVVRYVDAPSGDSLLLRDSDGNNVPDQLLTPVNETIGLVQLTNYELLLYRVDGTATTCISPIVSNSTTPDSEGRILWQIEPSMQLLSGTYLLRFTSLAGDNGSACSGRGRLPAGYAAQPIDAEGNVATFEISADIDQKVVVPPIEVAPYPTVSGRVIVPHLTGSTVSFVDFATAQASGLTVTIDCAGRTADGVLSSASGASGVSFEFDRPTIAGLFAGVAIAPDGALPACTLRSTFGTPLSFIPAEATLDNLRVGFTAPYPDQVLSVAMVTDPTIITGVTWWRDLGAKPGPDPGPADDEPTRQPAGGVSVVANDVTIGYTPSSANDPSPSPPTVVAGDPTRIPANLQTTSSGSGAWSFPDGAPRQVFGTADYTFQKPSEYDGVTTASITADQNGWSAIVGPGSPADSVVDTGSAVDAYLLPKPGSFGGVVTLTSVRGGAAMNEIRIAGTEPGAAAPTDQLTVTPLPFPTDIGTFFKNPANAGTWQLEYGSVATSNVVPWRGAATPRPLVKPVQPTVVPLVDMVELGQVSVEFIGTNGLAIPASSQRPSVTPTRTSTNAIVPATFASTPVPADTAGVAVVRRLPVDNAFPIGVSTTYNLEITASEFDVDSATIQIFDGTTPIEPPQAGKTISVSVVAGSQLRAVVTLPELATIRGAVTGLQVLGDPNPGPNLTIVTPPTTPPSGLTVTATRTDGPHTGDEFDAVVDPDDVSGLGYAVRVPAGTYTLLFQHPGYDDGTTTGVTVGVEGDVTANKVLELSRGVVDLTAIEGNAPIVNLSGATISLWAGDLSWPLPDTVPPSAPPPFFATTAVTTGNAQITGVYPGTYTVYLNKQDASGDDVNYPVLATIFVPSGVTLEDRTVTKVALMPPVTGSIIGTVVARNSNVPGDPVALPVDAVVGRSYNGPSLDPDGTTVTSVLDNRFDEDNLTPGLADTYPLVEDTPGLGDQFTFPSLPRGLHHLTFSIAAGYTEPTADDQLADGIPIADPYVYVASDVVVEIVLRSGSATGALITDATSLKLTPPGGGTDLVGDPTGTSGTYRFSAVPPRLATDHFTLTVDAPLHQTYVDDEFIVVPSAGVASHDVTMTQAAQITGIVRTKDSASGNAQVVANQLVQLYSNPAGPQPIATSMSGTDGRYDFPHVATGNYRIRASRTDYLDIDMPFAVTALIRYDQDLQLDRLASATMTVSGASDFVVTVSPNHGTSSSSGNARTFTGLHPGTGYTFTVAEGPLPAISITMPQSFPVTPAIGSSSANNHTFVYASVSGAVTNSFAGATVTLRTPSPGFGTVVATDNVSSAGNIYSFPGLAPGSYRVDVVRDADGVAGSSETFTINANNGNVNPNPPYNHPVPNTTTTTPPTTTTTTPPTTTTSPATTTTTPATTTTASATSTTGA